MAFPDILFSSKVVFFVFNGRLSISVFGRRDCVYAAEKKKLLAENAPFSMLYILFFQILGNL